MEMSVGSRRNFFVQSKSSLARVDTEKKNDAMLRDAARIRLDVPALENS